MMQWRRPNLFLYQMDSGVHNLFTPLDRFKAKKTGLSVHKLRLWSKVRRKWPWKLFDKT